MDRLQRALILLAVLAATACAGPSRYPDRPLLEHLASMPAPEKRVRTKAETVDVESWVLQGPLPTRYARLRDDELEPDQAAVIAAIDANTGAFVATSDMACVSREFGRFYLAKRGPSPEALRDFIARRCGSLDSDYAIRLYPSGIGEAADERVVFERWRAFFGKASKARPPAGHSAVGVWSGSEESRWVGVVATQRLRVDLEPVARVAADDGIVTLKGTLRDPAESVSVMIGRGAFDWLICEQDPAVQLPQFSFRCEMDKADAEARIELSAMEPGRPFSSRLLSFTVFPAGPPSLIISKDRPAGESGSPATESFGQDFVARLNEVRALAERPPVTLALRQSELAGKLVPHYFGRVRSAGGKESPRDAIYRGMEAGWEVDGMVYSARIHSTPMDEVGDPGKTLARFLESPSDRLTLLDPSVSQVMIGVSETREDGILWGSYKVYGERNYDEEIDGLLARLSSMRKEAGRPEAVWYADWEPLAIEASQKIEIKGLSPDKARRWLLDCCYKVVGDNVEAYLVYAWDLDELRFPDAFLDGGRYGMVAAIARYQPPGEALWRYVVILMKTKERPAAE